MKYYLVLLLLACSILTSCNNKKKPGQVTITDPAIQKNYAGKGRLQLQLTVDGVSLPTDSARYTVNEFGGMEIEGWGQRLTEGANAYTYTLSVRFGAFQGVGVYSITREPGTMFWQYKGYYISSGQPGSFTIDNWDDAINGHFEMQTDDGYGNKKVIAGTFRG